MPHTYRDFIGKTYADLFLRPYNGDAMAHTPLDRQSLASSPLPKAPNLSRYDQKLSLAPMDGLAGSVPYVGANMAAVAGFDAAVSFARQGALMTLVQSSLTSIERSKQRLDLLSQEHPYAASRAIVSADMNAWAACEQLIKSEVAANRFNETIGAPISGFGWVKETETAVDIWRLLAHLRQSPEDRIRSIGDIAPGVALVPSFVTTISDSELPNGNQACLDFLNQLTAGGYAGAVVMNASGQPVAVASQSLMALGAFHQPLTGLDGQGCGAAMALAAGKNESVELAEALLQDHASVVGFKVDTAHFDLGVTGLQPDVGINRYFRVLAHVRAAVDALPAERAGKFVIMAGNVATAHAARRVAEAGANLVSVGIGPGAACETRMQTAVGVPQGQAVSECVEALKGMEAEVMADGGVKNPRDAVLALALGSSRVMVGTVVARTHSAAGAMSLDDQGTLWRRQFGMASGFVANQDHRRKGKRADYSVVNSTSDALTQFYGKPSEGISDMQVKVSGSTASHLHDMQAGLRSAMTYASASSLTQFSNHCTDHGLIGIQSASGFAEGASLARF